MKKNFQFSVGNYQLINEGHLHLSHLNISLCLFCYCTQSLYIFFCFVFFFCRLLLVEGLNSSWLKPSYTSVLCV